MRFRELLEAECRPFLELSSDQLVRLESHYRLLLKWNEKMNLTRITSLEDAVRFHYAESLFLAAHLGDAGRILDIGSGAGFPGIPVAIARPQSIVMLVESDQRKAVFLKEAARTLANVKVIAKRAEQVADDADWIISRAVASRELQRLKNAPRFALLVGHQDADELKTKGWTLTPTLWGEQRYLACVSRETVSSAG